MTNTPKNASTSDNNEIDADDDIFEDGEFSTESDNSTAPETIKRDARRKIEIYWEKKRLRDEFDDFDDSEFGFD